MKHLLITLKRSLIPPLCWLLGVVLGSIAAPVMIAIAAWLLREPTYKCPYTAQGAADYSPADKG